MSTFVKISLFECVRDVNQTSHFISFINAYTLKNKG